MARMGTSMNGTCGTRLGIFSHQKTFGAMSDHSSPYQAECRCADNSEQGFTLRDQGQIDREFISASNEFLRAIQRIDQKKAMSVRTASESTRSSDKTEICGTSFASPSAMMRSEARSASVTGDPSDFPSTLMP